MSNAALSEASPNTRGSGWSKDISLTSAAGIGLIVAFANICATVLLRSYNFIQSPPWVETYHHLEFPFILIEAAVILWARHCGLRFRNFIGSLARLDRLSLVLFLTTFWISSIFVSPAPALSGLRAFYGLIHIAFAISVFHLAKGSTDKELKFAGVLQFVSLALFTVIMIIHLAGAPDIEFDGTLGTFWQAAIPGFFSVRLLGIWAGGILSLALGCLWMHQKIRHYGLVYATIAVATALLCWSGTRAGVLGVGVAMIVLLSTVRRLPPLRLMAGAFLAMVIGAGLSLIWIPPDSAFGLLQLSSRLDPAADISNGRMLIWTEMLREFASHPILGMGEGATRWSVVINGVSHPQPHNSVIQFLSSWGLIATVPAMLMLTRIRVAMHHVAKARMIALPLVVLFDAMLAMSLVDGVMYFSRLIMLTAVAGAITLAIGSGNEKQTSGG
jgi:exopolysaccharide production protein ExoQ